MFKYGSDAEKLIILNQAGKKCVIELFGYKQWINLNQTRQKINVEFGATKMMTLNPLNKILMILNLTRKKCIIWNLKSQKNFTKNPTFGAYKNYYFEFSA